MVYQVLKVHKVFCSSLETWAQLVQKVKMVLLEVTVSQECLETPDNQDNKDVEVHLAQLVGQDSQVLTENKVPLDNQLSSMATLLPDTVRQLNYQNVRLE